MFVIISSLLYSEMKAPVGKQQVKPLAMMKDTGMP
jgi:hypothetical protein